MPKELILDNEYATLWYDSDLKAVRLLFKKAASAEAIRDILCRGGDILEIEGARKWLSDSRENSDPPREIEEWAVGTWLPQMLKAGWKFWALVMPLSEVGSAEMQHHANVYSSFGITTRIFSDPDEAIAWLAAQ